jgi:3-hydroxyisobutyrate dehydrogenase
MTSWNHSKKQPMPRIAVVGTGTMGSAMAVRLLNAGMEVSIWSRHAASTMPLVDHGATAYEKPTDAVLDADVVITMLPTAKATADVMLDDGALLAMTRSSIWIQMATIGVETTKRLVTQTRVRRPGVTFVDAPVSGSRGPAEQGQLLILASGPQRAAQPLEPVFAQLGRTTLWLGPAGAGSAMKLVLNAWLAFQAEGAAESAALAERMGVPSTATPCETIRSRLLTPWPSSPKWRSRTITRISHWIGLSKTSIWWLLKQVAELRLSLPRLQIGGGHSSMGVSAGLM